MTSEAKNANICLYCERSSDLVPLIQLEYQTQQFWICPQHLPILIHDPNRLVGKLPGADALRPADHHDH